MMSFVLQDLFGFAGPCDDTRSKREYVWENPKGGSWFSNALFTATGDCVSVWTGRQNKDLHSPFIQSDLQ
jgi:hypothetical protein